MGFVPPNIIPPDSDEPSPISPYTGEPYDPAWAVPLVKGGSSERTIQKIMHPEKTHKKRKKYGFVCCECYVPLPHELDGKFNITCPFCEALMLLGALDSDLIGGWTPPFRLRWRCVDCGFFPAFYRCRECAWRLCGECCNWPSRWAYSPGKGLCKRCRAQSSQEVMAHFPLDYKSPYIPGHSGVGYTTAEVSEALALMAQAGKAYRNPPQSISAVIPVTAEEMRRRALAPVEPHYEEMLLPYPTQGGPTCL